MQFVVAKPPIRFRCPRAGFTRQSSIRFSAIWIALLAALGLAGCGITYNTLPLTVAPSSLSFGSVPVGKTQTATVTLQNPSLQSVTLSGVQSADDAFKVSADSASTTIPAGGSANFPVTFAPTEAKNYSSQIVVLSGSEQTTLPVSGVGEQVSGPPPAATSPALQVSATTLQFGNVPINGDAQQSLTLTSSGSAPLQINTLNTSGTGFSAQTPSLPLTLQPGQTLTLPVTFVPKASGAASGQLVIASNAAESPSVTVSLVGNGESSAPPSPGDGTAVLGLSSTSIDFGSVAVGSQGSGSITLTSSGTADVVIQSLVVDGSDFSTGKLQLPLTLAPGQQVILPLTFAPSSAGAEQGKITLTDNADGSPNVINLSGTGTAAPAPTTASLSAPSSIEFGDVTVGSQGTKTITLVSTGTAPVTVSAIALTGASFSNSPAVLPQVLQPNQQMSLRVKFTPQADGDATGTVTITSNATSNAKIVVQMHGTGIATNVPALSASASSLSFGRVRVGSQSTKMVIVTSTGTAPASITAGSITGAFAATYAGVPVQNLSAPIVLQPGQQVGFNVTFSPSATGSATGQLNLSTDTGTPLSVSLTGSGIQSASPALTLSSPSLDFGDVQVGSTALLPLTLTSSGTAPVTISSGDVTGHGFQIASVAWPAGTTNWPVTLNPGDQLVLSIAFSPDAANSFAGDLSLTSDASGGTANVPLSGTGDAVPAAGLSVSPSSIDFGPTTVGSKVSRTVTLTSTGTAPLNVSAIAVSGAEFSVTQTSLPATLQPNQKLVLTVVYEPTGAGSDSGTLTITSNDPAGPATVSLGGSATASPSPQLTVNPTAVYFGSVPLNTASTQSVTLTSTGSGPVTITSATVTGDGFSVSGAKFPLTLNPNQSQTLQVQFDPSATGDLSGNLTLSSNSSGGATTTISLFGTGTAATAPQLTVSANSLSFGNVSVNSTATLPLTLTSTGTAPVTVSAASLKGTGFSASGVTFPVTLNPNQSVTLNVQFQPEAAGAATGQLTITSNSTTNATISIQLSGTGTAASTPQLLVSATSLAFGSVPVNSTSTLNLTLTSSGTAPVTVSSVAVKGTGFSDSGATFPVTLNPNQSVTLQVHFDPTSAGAVTGQITITSNSSTGATTQVTLTGTGTTTQHEIDLSWNAPSSSADPIAGYNVYRSTDGGTSFTKLNASPESDVAYTDSAVQSGTTYVYQVKSVDASGVESAPSNQISLAVP